MNAQLIQHLVSKLQTGNLKSIHLNALPGRFATRLDIKQLDILKPAQTGNRQAASTHENSLAKNFVFDNLLSKSKFRFKINFDEYANIELDEHTQKQLNLVARKLNSIVNQNEDNYLEHGIKPFSFAYPLLVKRSGKDPNKIIKAPVIIWNLDIKRSNKKQNEWIIEQSEDAPIYINEVLISHIASDEGIVIDDLASYFLDDNIIDATELLQIVNSLLKTLNSTENFQEPSLELCPDKTDIEQSTNNKARIIWSGVFGLFKTQKQSIIRDTANLADIDLQAANNNKYADNEASRHSSNTSVPTDPSQEEIVNTLSNSEYKLIQGPPGTGKSQSLTAIITNTLENGNKILVVCEKKTALNVIYNNLKKLDLHHFAAIIDDVNRDRKSIIDRVRQLTEDKEEAPIRFNEQMYDSRLEQYTAMVDDFNEKHHNLLKTIFLGYNTQEIIAEYLKLKKEHKIDERLLLEIDFQFNEDEYKHLFEIIEHAVDLFDEIPTEVFAYDILSPNNFTNEYDIQEENQIHEQLVKEFGFLENINREYFCLHNYKISKLSDDLEDNYNNNAIEEFTDNIKQLIRYWTNIAKETSKANLNNNYSKLLNNNTLYSKIKELNSLYDNISRHLENLTKIDEQLYLIAINKDKLPDSVDSKIIDFKQTNSFNSFFSSKHRAIKKFQAFYKSAYNKINAVISTNQMINTDNNLQEIIKDYVPIDNDIDDLKNKLQICINNKKWYREYHNWRYFFDNQTALEHNCLVLLKKTCSHKSWANVFKLNYINLFIEDKTRNTDLYNYNSKPLEKIGRLQDELKYLHRYKILKIWKDRAEQAITEYNKESNIKWLFNYRKNSKYTKKNTLRAIIHEEFDLFTDIFPIVLVNPVVCSSIFPLKPDLFEIVLFDEASQLRLEDTFSALIRAKIKVISGDKHQMPPTSYFSTDIALDADNETSEESHISDYDKTHPLFLAESESLLDFGNNLNPDKINTSFLDYHYRSKHPKLIDFSNAAFYGGRLVPMPAANDYKPIRYFNVGGEYKKNNTNVDEARKIINFLKNEYACNEDSSYPSLGIATFNMQQRNLIKDMINDECVANERFREKMSKIGEQADWFVKNLENIQGDERDIIIISTTFGKNAEGNFRQNFGQINTAKGYKLLNVIITRAKKQVYVFSSIPDEYISNYQDDIEKNGNKGKAILYAYIDYCRAIENNNEAQRKSILKLLSEACEEEKLSTGVSKSTSAFKTEVYKYLTQHIQPENLVQNYQLGGYTIDFAVVDSSGKAIVAIDCDGAYRHRSNQAFSHDLHRTKIFEIQGLKVYRIWAKAWHPNPDKELEKLLDFLTKNINSKLRLIKSSKALT